MISKKVFNADGANKRFLSDFIIQSEQFVRVYAYIYDNTLNPDGTGDILQNGSIDQADWVFPTNLWKRGADVPDSGDDLITIDKWDLVTNSILMYDAPLAPAKMWIEVATTPEEFGDTLTQPSVQRAEDAADAAVISRINAEASQVASAASETNAAASAAGAAASQSASAISAAAALASQSASASSQSAAATSEANADISEAGALAYKNAAAASEAAAAQSEFNANSSKLAAAVSASVASSSASAAAISETNAASSETNAAASAAGAAASQSASAISAAAALASKNEAATSETNSAASALTAQGWANIASASPALTTFKNKLINGGFGIWQRGTSFVSGGLGFFPDRWFAGSSTLVERVNAFPTGQHHGMRLVRAGGSANIGQPVELPEVGDTTMFPLGSTWTMSFWAKTDGGNGDLTCKMLGRDTSNTSTGESTLADGSLVAVLTSSWQKFEITMTTTASIGATHAIMHMLIGSTEDIYVAQAQLEEGDVATPFEKRPLGLEKMLCQRYYWRGAAAGYGQGNFYGTAGQTHMIANLVTFPVTMRDIPSIDFVNTPNYVNCTFLDLVISTVKDGFVERVTVTAAGSYRADTGIYEADAEL